MWRGYEHQKTRGKRTDFSREKKLSKNCKRSLEMALVWAINMTRKSPILFRRKSKPKADQRLKAVIGAQVRLAAVDGDVFALGGKALDLLDSVEQVSINIERFSQNITSSKFPF